MVFGFVISIQQKQNKRIFKLNKNILILSVKRKKLTNGTKLLFYNPVPISAIVGEATIFDIKYEKAEAILYKHNTTIQTLDELKNYLRESPIEYTGKQSRFDKLFAVITFENVHIYNKPIKLHRIMNPSGLYIQKFEYDNLMKYSK